MAITYKKSDLKIIKSILQEALDDLKEWNKHNEDLKKYEADEIQWQINEL